MVDLSLERRNFSNSSTDHNRASAVDKYFTSMSMSSTIISGQKRGRGDGQLSSVSALQQAQKRLVSGELSEHHLHSYFDQIRVFCNLLNLENCVLGYAKDIIYRFEKSCDTPRRILGKPS